MPLEKKAPKPKPTGKKGALHPPKGGSSKSADQGAPADNAEPGCPVAGFGASAGGLESFSELLHYLPNDTGMALVFVQHLDPKHASVLTELLGRSTRMPVSQVIHGMRVEPNRVYVIPPNTNITVSRGVLKVQPRPPGMPHMPIDHFFRSLAEDQGSKAIGVVLSGTASDGTVGLKAIKGEGGIAFAETPESAKYDGMPRSAIAAGCVDAVLTPEGIAGELARLCRHPYLSWPRPPEGLPENERILNEIFSVLRKATDVDFGHYKQGTIQRRMQRRMALHKLDTFEQYLRYLRGHRQEVDLLFQDILINVTGFFREPAAFSVIRSHVLPAIFKGRSVEETVRVWVPGCATGEEAYSVAMCLFEYIREIGKDIPIQVFGTDLSESVLTKARTGVYPESIAADVSPERLSRFFVRVNGSYQIARFVRDVCVFARQNVTKDPPFSKLDLVTCRNLLIYLGPVLQHKVMRLFHYAIRPSGFLVLGASENISGADDLFTPIDKHHKIYTRKLALTPVPADFGPYEERETVAAAGKLPVTHGASETHRKVDQMILARYSPAAVVVDKDLKVLQFCGQTAKYLGHARGDATLDLMRLAHGGLGPQIRKTVTQADQQAAPAKSGLLTVSVDGDIRLVRIAATPVHGLGEPQFLVVFEDESTAAAQVRPKPAPAGKRPVAGGRVRELEQELASTRQYLQSVIEEQETVTEELKSAHEEVQSSNEELQSTNEELLTAKEELQSTNEELTTVNDEMQSRNAELHQINNDLLNLLSSVNIPIVILGNDLRIRRFTPHAEKLLNIIPADVGRPISDFRVRINAPDLVEWCREVIDTLSAREREVQDDEGRTYSMWVRPYRTADNRIDGLVLTLADVTERKQATEARFRRLFEAAKDGIVVADAVTGEIVDVNPFITTRFGYPRSRLVGIKLWQSDLFRGTEVDESVCKAVQESESVQKTLALPADTGEQVDVDVVSSLYTDGERRVMQFTIRDISARRQMEEKQRRNEEQARQASKMEAVGRLAGGVAHDFNNLLTAISGFAELLEPELRENGSAREMLEQIRIGVERASALTRQLLAFGRKQIVAPKVLDANDAIAGMRQMASVVLAENIELVMDLQPDLGRVRADRVQLEQVFLNLVLNARDAMPGGGTITVSTANVDVDESFSGRHPAVPVGRYVAITVKDTGTGMDEETQKHLFEPFFTTKAKGMGVGLGLATVYNIVSQGGGHIWAYSELGVGSTFTLYLPRVEAESAAAQSTATQEEDLRGKETVLLVDDEAAVCALARRFLELHGYTVLEAHGGPEALRIAREYKGPIHLMVTDVVMPRMSGREVAFQLAPERPDMQVLYMSGHTEDAIMYHGVLEHEVAFLTKPFTKRAFLAKVRRLLDRSPQSDQF